MHPSPEIVPKPPLMRRGKRNRCNALTNVSHLSVNEMLYQLS
jgi:hypothetical protein